MLWISILAIIVAAASAIVGYLVFRSQVDPEVIVYLKLDEQRSSFILLVIENIGKGAAANVRFIPSKPLPAWAFGISEDKADPFQSMTEGAIVTGIPFLEPGGKRIFTWGQFGGLKKHLGDGVSVTVGYEHRHLGWPFALKKNGTFPLELNSFAGGDIADLNWDKQAANHLKEIAASLKEALKLVKRLLPAQQ